ncbi:MAG TPA: hypothetical protein VF503_15455 [Sphingobium sp.]|uniref:hypothetical protein n=1 Tax=Sphingobium sp. TaxID=1912891 RepID=UPI002ED27F75
MPLWLDLLRTPMAAPETQALKRLRFTWQGLCFASALIVGFFAPLHRAVGRTAAFGAAALLLATATCTIVYLFRKQRADGAFLETIGRAE